MIVPRLLRGWDKLSYNNWVTNPVLVGQKPIVYSYSTSKITLMLFASYDECNWENKNHIFLRNSMLFIDICKCSMKIVACIFYGVFWRALEKCYTWNHELWRRMIYKLFERSTALESEGQFYDFEFPWLAHWSSIRKDHVHWYIFCLIWASALDDDSFNASRQLHTWYINTSQILKTAQGYPLRHILFRALVLLPAAKLSRGNYRKAAGCYLRHPKKHLLLSWQWREMIKTAPK